MCGRSVWKQPACNGKQSCLWLKHKQSLRTSRLRFSLCSHHRGEKVQPIYIYAFSRHFYPKRLTIAFRLYIFYQYLCSLGIEPTIFCAANAMLYRWATQEHLWRCPVSIDTALSEKLWSASVITFTCCSCWRYTMSAPKRLFKCLFWDALTNIGVSIDSPHRSRWGHCGYVSLSKEISQKKLKKVPNTCNDQYQRFVHESLHQTKYDAFVFQIAFLKELLGTL